MLYLIILIVLMLIHIRAISFFLTPFIGQSKANYTELFLCLVIGFLVFNQIEWRF